MDLKLKGKIKLIGEVQQVTDTFKKVEFVITTNGEYPQDVKFEITQDKIDNFTKFNKVGQDVEVSFNIRGNEYQGKYYVNLQAWSVFSSGAEVEATTSSEPQQITSSQGSSADDNLPF